jgi:ornithine decarboxylase
MVSKSLLQKLARKHGTPLFVIDHDELRKNYRQFRKYLPRVQVYFAVKANSDPAIVRTLYKEGSSFDVASMPEFKIVYDNIKKMPAKQRQQWIWDKIIYANPIKDIATLEELNPYKPLVTYDNPEEIAKLKKYAPKAGLVLRIRVPNTGAVASGWMCTAASDSATTRSFFASITMSAPAMGMLTFSLETTRRSWSTTEISTLAVLSLSTSSTSNVNTTSRRSPGFMSETSKRPLRSSRPSPVRLRSKACVSREAPLPTFFTSR